MSNEYRQAVFATSSWKGLSEVGAMPDAGAMIAAGEASGCWPVGVAFDRIVTAGGLKAPGRAVVANYADGSARALGVVGKQYRATAPAEWRELVTAAVAAGAAPTGVFQIGHGARVVATFDVGGNGIRTQLVLADSFDGSLRLTAGTTCIRMRCANQMAAVMRADGAGMAALRHTANLETKVNALREAIGETIRTGEKVRDAYHQAEAISLSYAGAEAVLAALFPVRREASDKGYAAAQRRAETARENARRAMAMEINRVESAAGGVSLATVWNGATYLVDRTENGAARPTRGDADAIDSLLFGARAKRIEEIQAVVEVVMTSGELKRMTVGTAREHGIDDRQIGRRLLAEMLEA